MTRDEFLRKREARLQAEWKPRAACPGCRKALPTCYCARVEPFAASPLFVILLHRDEAKRGVASGRMAHRIVSNSMLFEGIDYTHDPRVNALLADPTLYPMVVYPSRAAVNLSEIPMEKRAGIFPEGRRPVFILIDGTWGTARKMRRLSRNLHGLPNVMFQPDKPSRFRVRKQPKANCLSTLEAIHQMLDLIPGSVSPTRDRVRPQDNLLEVFDYMVEMQLQWSKQGNIRNPRKKMESPNWVPRTALAP